MGIAYYKYTNTMNKYIHVYTLLRMCTEAYILSVLLYSLSCRAHIYYIHNCYWLQPVIKSVVMLQSSIPKKPHIMCETQLFYSYLQTRMDGQIQI